MKTFNGKMKALTFSYDDGVRQDKHLVELFNKYNLKGTFNISSELFGKEHSLVRDGVEVDHTRIGIDEAREIYKGHEVAAHTLRHKNLTEMTEENIINAVEKDRQNLSDIFGYEIVGMAYPCGGVNNDERVASVIKSNTGIKYARTITSTYSFDEQTNLHQFNPTVYHIKEAEKMFELGEKFLALNPTTPQIFYVWGHSYEFDIADTWSLFESFCKMMSNHDDISYGTNKEILL